MANTLPARVTITAVSIAGDSVAKTFNSVTEFNVNYYENTIRIQDVTGTFYFGYNPVTTVTYTIAAGVTTITIS